MTISDAGPIQFWINGEPTFNESNPICGLTSQCFCQPFNCDDELTIQFQDEFGLEYELVIYDSAENELTRLAFDEVSSGVFQISFTPNELSPPICEKISFSINGSHLNGWESQVPAANNAWVSITYSPELDLFVAVSPNGSGNRVMTSPDGITWTSQTSAANNSWGSVTWGNGLFVAVSASGTGNRVMTSPDGVVWTSQVSAADNSWTGVTYGNGLFVAVAQSGTGNRVMTSPDGVTWTPQVSAADYQWMDVAFGNGVFVAVARTGTGDRVMTSPDGVTWTLQTSAVDNSWNSVTYGNGVFVAVASTGTDDRIMTSVDDGVTWVSVVDPGSENWNDVTFGDNKFLAVASSGTGFQTMISFDNGTSWTLTTPATTNAWNGVIFGSDKFVAVSTNGTNDRVMTFLVDNTLAESDCIDLRNNHQCSKLISYTNSDDFDGIVYDISPQPTFYLRVPAQLLEDENPQTQEDLELSNGIIVTIRQTIQEKSIFKLGYMPPYMHTKVQKVLMHDTVVIDDIQWKRRDPYEAPRLEDYPLKKGEVLLTKYNSVLKNTI